MPVPEVRRVPGGKQGGYQVHDEESLVGQAVGGNQEAFATLYERYFDPVYRYIAVRVGNHNEAEDITEQVFLKALEAIPSFRWRGAPFSSWLFRIAHNGVVDYFRKNSKGETVSLDKVVVFSDHDVVQEVDFRLTLQELLRALEHLTEFQRQAIALRFAGGLSLAETARAMGKSEGAVKSLQHDALVSLRRLLAPRSEFR